MPTSCLTPGEHACMYSTEVHCLSGRKIQTFISNVAFTQDTCVVVIFNKRFRMISLSLPLHVYPRSGTCIDAPTRLQHTKDICQSRDLLQQRSIGYLSILVVVVDHFLPSQHTQWCNRHTLNSIGAVDRPGDAAQRILW